MKKLLSLILAILLLQAASGAAHAAAPTIAELPDVKIVMDGRITKFSDVPISIGQNTLLPLRELFLNLGVAEGNISYNALEKSVTVTKDETKLYLAVGNQTAICNGVPVRLPVAPVGYSKNQRIYIPFRFAAEALGKKVVWDGSSRTILVCDAYKFDMMKQILDRSNAAMNQLQKCGIAMDVNGTVKSGQVGMKLGMSMDSKIDRINGAAYSEMILNLLGTAMDTKTYFINNLSYTLNSPGGKWEKNTFSQAEYERMFESQSNLNLLNTSDALCAGLVKAEGRTADEVVLKGDVYPGELFRKALPDRQGTGLPTAPDNTDFKSFYLELVVDNTTSLLKRVVMHVTYDQPRKAGNQPKKAENQSQKAAVIRTDFKIQVQYSDYNGDFQITVPGEVIQNAVETKAAN